MEFIHKIISEPFPDYPSDDDSTKEEDGDKTKREITQAMKTGSRFNISVGRQGVLGASSRALDQTDTDITGEQRTNLAKSANLFRGDIQKRSSRFDQTPATDNIRQKFQDDYLKRKDRKYKDSHLPLVKEKNKFHLGPSKQKVALQLRQTYYDTKDGLLIPENNDTMLSTSNFVQKKGTLGRAIGRKLFLLAQGGQNVYDIPQSEAFAVAGSVRLFPNTKQKRVTQDASNEREFSVSKITKTTTYSIEKLTR